MRYVIHVLSICYLIYAFYFKSVIDANVVEVAAKAEVIAQNALLIAEVAKELKNRETKQLRSETTHVISTQASD